MQQYGYEKQSEVCSPWAIRLSKKSITTREGKKKKENTRRLGGK